MIRYWDFKLTGAPPLLSLFVSGSGRIMPLRYTAKQGQYLSFIYYYTLINRCAPAEADIRKFFRVSAPSVHQMLLALERGGLISRIPGQSRSITLNLPREDLPNLEPVDDK